MGEANSNTTGELTIRAVELADAEAIAAIYNPEVLTSTVTFDLVPRTLDEQREWIVEHSGSYPAIVAVEPLQARSEGRATRLRERSERPGALGGASAASGGEVVGFACLSPYRPRPAYATTVESSVYVRTDRQGGGVGRALMERLVEVAVAHGFHSMVARIVGGHEASIALHEKVGFAIVGTEIEVGRKFGRWLDVVVMQRML
jgi:phosphinothricin acetyltransferase